MREIFERVAGLRPAEWAASTAAAAALALTLGLVSCNPAAQALTDAPAPGDLEPFDPANLQLYYQLSFEQTHNLLEHDTEVLVIDVRTPDEFARGHFPGAVNYDVEGGAFEAEIGALPREQKLAVYSDGIPGRQEQAMSVIRKLEFKTVYEIRYGFMEWVDAGYAYVQDMPGADPRYLRPNPDGTPGEIPPRPTD
ncbi:MAG: rhodanese-like domain-containing protein [Akkermansiaceae bacterium]|nr:rhodanese-like domain-containing protein [Akkermansiaceae bacterium]